MWRTSRSKNGGKDFVCVFHGKLSGNHLVGQFADVPEGRNRYDGALKAKLVIKDGRIVVEGEAYYTADEKPRPWSMSRTPPKR